MWVLHRFRPLLTSPLRREEAKGRFGGEKRMDAIKNVVALAVAVLALVATALLIVFLLGKVGDENWERYVYLLSGVEAIAFAATGWLFGKEVHREQAQTAEAGRKDAERTKDLALSEAADQRRKGVETA